MIAAAVLMMVAAPPGAPITLEVRNVRSDHGLVRVDICPRARFLADECPWHAAIPATPGTVTVTIMDVPPGDYAVQAFHDENDNDRIDRGLFGIPKEGVGFSRDARIAFGPPKWSDAVFTHGRAPQTIGFALRYFTGPSGPAERRKR